MGEFGKKNKFNRLMRSYEHVLHKTTGSPFDEHVSSKQIREIEDMETSSELDDRLIHFKSVWSK